MKYLNLPHSLYACHLTARQIKPVLRQIRHWLDSGTIVTHSSKRGYKFLVRSLNPYLFSLLDSSGFWDFHCTNVQKQICSLHQVVLYIHVGYNYFLYGYTCPAGTYEIHHLDSDPSNNTLENLEYVTPQENQILASIVRMSYDSNAKSAHIGVFNRKSPKSHFAKLARLTFLKTFTRLGFKVPATTIADWLLSLPSELGSRLYKYWLEVPSIVKICLN